MAMQKDTIYDELITFLSEPMFQVPVRSYMDEHCLIFDIDSTPVMEHKEIFDDYKAIVYAILEGFCEEADISFDDVIKSIKKLNTVQDLQDMFHGIFEQVMSAIDFNLFYPLMAKKNIIIQEQVLTMILMANGFLPDSLTRGKKSSIDKYQICDSKEEEELINLIVNSGIKEDILKSNVEAIDSEPMEILSLDNTKKEFQNLKASRLKIEKQLKEIIGKSVKNDYVLSESEYNLERVNKQKEEKNFQSFSEHNNQSKLSPEDVKQRQDFLRQQRDKLIQMKRESMEKKLHSVAEDSYRPKSTRATKMAMLQNNRSEELANEFQNAEEKKRSDKRKSIVEKLKNEVIGK